MVSPFFCCHEEKKNVTTRRKKTKANYSAHPTAEICANGVVFGVRLPWPLGLWK